jgi:hypothetical protein
VRFIWRRPRRKLTSTSVWIFPENPDRCTSQFQREKYVGATYLACNKTTTKDLSSTKMGEAIVLEPYDGAYDTSVVDCSVGHQQ